MIPNFASFQTADGSAAWRGGQPIDGDWTQLKNLGVVRVVKLNTEEESYDLAADLLGMELIFEPINLDDQIILRPKASSVHAAVDAIKPGAFVHCEHGQDRTGLIVGCYRVWKQGWTKADAWKEMLDKGFHPELLGLTLFWEWAV